MIQMNLLLFLLTSYCYGELSSLPFSDCGDGFVLVGETDGEVEPECDEHECPQVDSCVTCKDLCDNDESCEAYECNFSEDKVSCSFNGHFALTEECGPLCESQKVCVKNSTEINGVNFISNGRRNLGEPAGPRRATQKARCRDGYYDATNGNAKWWFCGSGCPGGRYWVDDQCQCACEFTHLNLCGNGAGGSFPCSATMSRSEMARRACESVYDSCTQRDCHPYKLWSHSSGFCDDAKIGDYQFIYETSGGRPTSFIRQKEEVWWSNYLPLGIYQSTKYQMKFSHGRARCIQQGGNLFTPRSTYHYEKTIKDTLPYGRNVNAWLGIQQLPSNMHWVHADGSHIHITNWASGNPGNYRSGAAVLATSHNGKWFSWSRHATNRRRAYVVCEIPGFYWDGEHALTPGDVALLGRRALALTEEKTLIETDAGTVPIERKL